MKKLFFDRNGRPRLLNVKEPLIETKGSIVRTNYALISPGTELATIKNIRFSNLSMIKKFRISKEYRKIIYSRLKENKLKAIVKLVKLSRKKRGNKNFTTPSIKLKPLGYSCSGVVLDSNVANIKIDDRVACAGSNHAELIFSPKNLTCKVPGNVSLEEAAFVSLGAIALHGIHRAHVKPGDNVGVIGAGLIGLLTVQLSKVSGARVIAFDLLNKRLKLAKKLGADLTANPRNYNLNNVVSKFTDGNGLDSIIICASSKSPKPLEDAIELIRFNGKIVMLGLFPIKVNRRKLYYKEADLLISRSYGPGRYDYSYEYEGIDYLEDLFPWTVQRNIEFFLKLLSEKKIDVHSLISEIIPIEYAKDAYHKLEMDPLYNIAILLNFIDKTEYKSISKKKEDKEEKPKKLIIGLIGCGNFAQKFHIPYLLPHPKCKIKAICTKSKSSAEICKKKFNPEYVTTNYKKILKDPDINTVFIYTRHGTHAHYTIEALQANKNVYCEKPMALTMEECHKIYETVKASKKKYSIGFNRRYSPFIKIAKELLKNRNNPIIINYRIASSFLSGNHWVFDSKEGGGPIIGEFCHFTDLIQYLMNSKPIELIAKGGSLSHKDTNLYESCVVIIKFTDNSIANLIYTDLNGPNMPKERIEIFSGDSSIIIDDFLKLITSGFDSGNLFLNEQDKGHENEVNNVIESYLGFAEPLVGVEDAIRAMDLAFKTIESIKNNKSIMIENDFYE